MLMDLAQLKQAAEQQIQQNGNNTISITHELKQVIADTYSAISPNDILEPQDAALYITSTSGLSAYLPYQWFMRIKCCSPFIDALTGYADHVIPLGDALTIAGFDSALADLPMVAWEANMDAPVVSEIGTFINNRFPDPSQAQHFRNFLDGRSWLDTAAGNPNALLGKKLNRGKFDYIGSCVKKISRLIDAMAGKYGQCIRCYMESGRLRRLVENAHINHPASPPVGFSAENRIYYGAPGTGKSHAINAKTDGYNSVETVFHPDTQYSDFVGCLKPSMDGDDIQYSFRPGPFCEALSMASDNPELGCYLVIEEINRACAAAVFGEIFQLLDRTPTGESQYGISISDPDMKGYLDDNALEVMGSGKLKIPANLSILGTMNSSDQAVMPMDTAFKRRWKFEYVPIDFGSSPDGTLRFMAGESMISVSWKDFALAINDELAGAEIPEDRLLGPWFLGHSELADAEASRDALSGKLFMYLWDDVLRHDDRSRIFSAGVRNYGELVRKYHSGGQIFSDTLVEKMRASPSCISDNGAVEDDVDAPANLDGSAAGADILEAEGPVVTP